MTPYILSNGHQGDAQAKINDLQQMNEQLERELAAWETELSKVMPPDYKDWWQNDKREWPLVARLVIESKNRHAELDAAAYEKLERELAAITCDEGELWELRQANARMKDNLATLSKLHADEMTKAQKSFEFQLAAERALADRLAGCMAHLADYDWFIHGTHSHSVVCSLGPDRVREALAAWKGARDE